MLEGKLAINGCRGTNALEYISLFCDLQQVMEDDRVIFFVQKS
jgi:hypothetical protein